MIAGKNGEYSFTRDVDEAFTRALADVSKPFVVDSKDDSLLSHFQVTSRLPDSMASLNDEELMKQLATVLFCRSTTSPTDELADSISELSGGLVSNDLRGITQTLSSSSLWGTASVDCDGVSSDTKLTHSGIEAAYVPNGIIDNHTCVTTLSLPSFSSGAGISSSFEPLSSGSTNIAVASTVTAVRQSDPLSLLPPLTVATCSCMSVKRTSETNAVLSTPADSGTSSLDSLLAPIMAAPVLHIGSLPALPQVFVSTPASLLVSAPGSASLPSVGLPSLQTLPDVHTLMKPSRRYIVDSRPMVTSGLSALPLASIFTPFSTAFCPPPPVSSSSVIKMDHPLAATTVLATVSVASCSPSTVCSCNTATSSVVPSVSVVQFTVGQTAMLPSSLSSSSAVSYQTSLSGT